ncbi:MAG: glycoside hydrolase family 88 protein [Tepidisphaeraceae bacterium]|jgi:unsaturated rhamnogalacturonyl hydrolase
MTHLLYRSAFWVALALISIAGASAFSAEPSATARRAAATRASQSSPVYPIPYHTPRVAEITRILLAVKTHIESSSMTHATTHATTDPADPDFGRRFALVSYPMGVIYSGMLSAADATGDASFADFDAERFKLFADAVAKVDLSRVTRRRGGDVTFLLSPTSLDDCGSVGASLIQARRAGVGPDLKIVIDRIADYISHKQLRLDDGTLARPRPFHNSVWADDSYMSIPFLSQMGALTGDSKYLDDAATQMLDFAHYLYIPSAGFFTHHWNTANPDDQPRYYWGRANGWMTLAMADLLDVLPKDHPLRDRILRLFRANAQALASAQAGDGLWHQMLDRTDTYTETSCSAMFVYALAHGVNRGWLDAGAYGPVAQAGWDGLTTRIDAEGHVTGTCVGTGYADDFVYYYHRPAVDDIHGYGPVLLAGSELIRLVRNTQFRITPPDRGGAAIYGEPRSVGTTRSDQPPADRPEY